MIDRAICGAHLTELCLEAISPVVHCQFRATFYTIYFQMHWCLVVEKPASYNLGDVEFT